MFAAPFAATVVLTKVGWRRGRREQSVETAYFSAMRSYSNKALEEIVPSLPNKRCSRQALFGCGFAAMVILCLQLN